MPVDEAQGLLDAHYMPPASMGEVYHVVEHERPDVIGIIDGYFDSVPAVWHKEILFALTRGVRVVGGSSIGALRAAELASFGMEGVGWVFEAFRRGELEDDDEVAVAHGQADTGYRCVSDAMVNLRMGLLRARERGLITTATRAGLVTLAKRHFYPERSWERLLREGADHGFPADELRNLRIFIEAECPNIKREDACELLKRLAVMPRERTPTWHAEFLPTVFWQRLTKSERQRNSRLSDVQREDIRRIAKAEDANFSGLLRAALLMHLVEKECEDLGVQLTQEKFDATLRDFRIKRELASGNAMRSWLELAGLSVDHFRAVMQIETQTDALLSIYRSEVDERLVDALALSGRLGDVQGNKTMGDEEGGGG
jgi:hypothetical protein